MEKNILHKLFETIPEAKMWVDHIRFDYTDGKIEVILNANDIPETLARKIMAAFSEEL